MYTHWLIRPVVPILINAIDTFLNDGSEEFHRVTITTSSAGQEEIHNSRVHAYS